MKYLANVEDKKPDLDERSLRYVVNNRGSEISLMRVRVRYHDPL
jgi:hypothetical protein